jgi:hypothetical protein
MPVQYISFSRQSHSVAVDIYLVNNQYLANRTGQDCLGLHLRVTDVSTNEVGRILDHD